MGLIARIKDLLLSRRNVIEIESLEGEVKLPSIEVDESLEVGQDATLGENLVELIKSIAPQSINVILSLTSTTLSEEDLALMTNGKPTLIVSNETSEGFGQNAFFFPSRLGGTIYRGLVVFSASATPSIGVYKIENSVIGLYGTGTNNGLNLRTLNEINGKSIPDYPSNTGSFTLKCVNGTLTWVADE